MIIAVNTIVATHNNREENAAFINESFERIITQQPNHTFIIISDKKDHPLSLFKNVVTEITLPKRNNLLQWHVWLNFKIPAILKKYKAGVFFSCAAISFRSVNARQQVFFGDLSFLLQPSLVTKKDIAFHKRFFLKSVKKADKVFAVSEFCSDHILRYSGISSAKMTMAYPGITPDAISISHEERERIKTVYAGGHEYFVYSGIIDEQGNLLNLLKAFSAFKKRQKSNMQLLLAGREGLRYENFKEKLRLFKFKEDVKVLTGLSSDEEKKLISAAYTFISVPLSDCFATQCLRAMQLFVPVITSSSGAMPEICGDAALYANPEDFQAIALQMMHLFKDENLRKKLIEKGKARTQKFDWNITAKLIWESMITGVL
ncbi:MAG TPA: glycosyltransferase family 1 protein [Chitinophagaceae bacterium]|nr:glycosyltransferase family 1 protein [Chitinophagaceae bacterium]